MVRKCITLWDKVEKLITKLFPIWLFSLSGLAYLYPGIGYNRTAIQQVADIRGYMLYNRPELLDDYLKIYKENEQLETELIKMARSLFVAQWIERWSPAPGAQVRFGSPIGKSSLLIFCQKVFYMRNCLCIAFFDKRLEKIKPN